MIPLRYKFLLLLYTIWAELETDGGPLFHPYRYLLASFRNDYKKKSIQTRISELASVGNIERVKRDGEVYFRITSQGKKAIEYEVPLLRFRRKWDGLWRLVIFDIAEEERNLRDVLREKLKSLGFGRWQRSIWITPFDIAEEIDEFLGHKEVKGPVEILEAKRLFVESEKELAERVWKLGKLNKGYETLVEKWEEGSKKWEENPEELKKLAASLQERHLDLLWKDPGLPKALLPPGWQGEETKKLFREWARVLS